ncbi:unnamed protein product, partial [Rotaria magnacalcarata]
PRLGVGALNEPLLFVITASIYLYSPTDFIIVLLSINTVHCRTCQGEGSKYKSGL